jgi:Reverse transcriptase (RNA-dependent DNA polymerase)
MFRPHPTMTTTHQMSLHHLLRAWQRRTLPRAFNRCVAQKRTPASSSQKHTSHKGAHKAFAIASGVALLEKTTPQSWREAMSSPDSAKWRAAAQAEFDGCVKAGVWKVVPRSSLPKGANVIRSKWVFKVKTNELGAIAKYKARITPKGYMQRHGVDYFEVYACTGMYKTMRAFFSVVASRDQQLRQLDVPQAFTQAPLEEVVYMEMPEGFVEDGMVCQLMMSLYGLKQGPRNWWILLSTFLIDELGFTSTTSDPCLFVKTSRTGGQIRCFVFVDDVQAGFDDEDEGEWGEYQTALERRFNITDLGPSKFMLGMRITRDRTARTIKLDQELYVSKGLEKFGLHECTPRSTPGVSIDAHEDDDCSSELDQPCDLKLYQEKVGTLLYAAISSRPDISFAVNKLTQKMQSPTLRDSRACDRVFRYLAGTKSYGLLFGRQRIDVSQRRDTKVAITAWADADWASDRIDRKSITGWVAMLDGDIVSWASKKQKVVSQSSCEAELYAEAAAINETKWLSGLLREMGLEQSSPPLIYGDNQSALSLSKNGIKSERTKHVAIKYAYIHDEVSHDRVRLQWVPSAEQLADILTKSLARQLHERLRDQLMTN